MRTETVSTVLRRRGSRAGALLVMALVAAWCAMPAAADRNCLADPALTGRGPCSETECVALQDAVNSACKNPAPTRCSSISGCSALRAMKQRWLNCAIARDTINARCWSGGDPGHQERSASAWQHVGACQARIALPEPVGCADPCPQSPGPTSMTTGAMEEREAGSGADADAGAAQRP